MQDVTPIQALEAAAELAGSQSALARICGVSQTATWKWLNARKSLPAEHVLKVEAATGVSRHLLRPDIYPADALPSSLAAPLPPVAVNRRAELTKEVTA